MLEPTSSSNNCIKMKFILNIFVIASLLSVAKAKHDNRLAVIEDRLSRSESLRFFAFLTDQSVMYSVGQETSLNGIKWKTEWRDLGYPSGLKAISNPVLTYTATNATAVLVQCSDGQLYTTIQEKPKPGETVTSFSKWSRVPVPSRLPYDKGYKPASHDSVTAIQQGKRLYIFARSLVKNSSLFYSVHNGSSFSKWFSLGGKLASDAAVILNPYSGFIEAFAVFQDGALYRNWQYEDNDWGSWTKHSYGQPDVVVTSRPVVHNVKQGFFNGRLEVFALGRDGYIHHTWQTTCDGVKNPWGYCTWGWWYKIKTTQIPRPLSLINSLSVGSNVHLGNELFVLDNNGSLWHMWQLERGDSWNKWSKVENKDGAGFTLPYVTTTRGGWWAAHITVKKGNTRQVSTVMQKHDIRVSPEQVKYGGDVTVSWLVPVDEATGMDWVGIYPSGMGEEQYVDYRYVQGGQNPRSGPVTKGQLKIRSFLPAGGFQVRYLVNRKFISVMQAEFISERVQYKEPWEQFYDGLVVGLGRDGLNLKRCVKDGNKTIHTFEKAFTAFENVQLVEGLQLMGVALKDVYETLIQCSETVLAQRLLTFINDLVACTRQSCVKFLILVSETIMVLYENIYEIFGDTRAAVNSVKLFQGYKQAGLCIGRLVEACVSLPPAKNGSTWSVQEKHQILTNEV